MKPTPTLAAIPCKGALSTIPGLSRVVTDWDASNGSGVSVALWTDSVVGVVAAKGGGGRCN